MKPTYLAITTAWSIALCACGGSGGGGGTLASTPPPAPAPVPSPAPSPSPTVTAEREVISTIASPATKAATYDTIALVEGLDPGGTPFTRMAAPGEVRIQTDPAISRYTMLFSAADIPTAMATHVFESRSYFTFGDEVRFGNVNTTYHDYSDGSTKEWASYAYRVGDNTIDVTVGQERLRETLQYNVGLSYVSLGEWAYGTLAPSGRTNDPNIYNPRARVLFVAGERTPSGAIPLSGTATYTASSLGYDTDADDRDFIGFGAPIDILLRADFGQRSMFAQLTRAYSLFGDAIGGFIDTLGVDLHGTGTIGTGGDFFVPLIGTLSYGTSSNTAVTGSLNGAFFGPNAEQVGGVFAVGEAPGTTLVSDAFVGVKN